MIKLLDDFNYGRFDADDWTQIQGGSVRGGFTSGAHSFFFGGNEQRIAETITLDLSNGGTINFFLTFGDDNNGGENVNQGEDVVLEYSIDNGSTWTQINTYDSEDYTSWARITENVPAAALSAATRFRWRQIDFDTSTTVDGVDNWGLDHVQIADTALSPVNGVLDDFNYGYIDWENWADLKGGSIISDGMTSGAHALFFGSSSDGGSQRLLESMPVDVSTGRSISFFLRFGDDNNGGENADPGEDVVLEYSLDEGDTWITLNTYDTEDYTSWTRITEDVPDAALSPATRFRWRQIDFSNSTTAKGQDNWSLDHVSISGSGLESLDSVSDDFNYSTTDWINWADIKGGAVRSGFTSGAHSLFFGASGEAGGQRLAATNPVDVSAGGTVSFDLVTGDGSNGGANADPGEDVVLEYSTDGGSTWVLVNTYDSEDYTAWTRINENVPTAALSDATRFRLRQLSFDDSSAAKGNDNWGIDNFSVVRTALIPQTAIVDDFNYSTVDSNDWVDIKGGSVRSGFTTGAHSLYFGSSSDGGGQRLIESVPIDTQQGGNVGFYLIFGDGTNGGENADSGEDVVLEYSTDDGQTWNVVNTYDTEDYTSWTWINEAVPAEAMGPSTSFRLRQTAFSSSTSSQGVDNWGIDQLTITGAAQLPRSVISDDFNYGTIDTDDWADIKGGSVRSGFTSGAHSLFFGSASDGGGQRLAEALPVDVRGGGTIQFDLTFGTGSNGGNDAEAAEDVVLEYSTNGGSTWNLLSTYDTEAYTEWTRITETVPTVAQSANTSFRLRQVKFDASTAATGADNWGLDNFSIVAAPLPANSDVDLVIEDVTLSTSNAVFGDTTDVSWTVRNQGSDASDSQWSDRIVLSTDTLVSDDDIVLGTFSGYPTALAAGETYTQIAVFVTLPENTALADGNYYVLVQTDLTANQAETDETNNVGSAAIALAATPAPADIDLNITTTSVSVDTATLGDRVNISWTVSNQGVDTTDSKWSDRLYLSADGTISPDDIALGSLPAQKTQLAPGESYSQTLAVDLPIVDGFSNGNYQILVQTDDGGQQAETLETNNVGTANLEVNKKPFALDRISTSRGSNLGQTTITLKGSQFQPDASVRLVAPDGRVVVANDVQWQNGTELWATFDLQGQVIGQYDVSVQQSGDGAITLTDRFEVTDGSEGNLDVEILAAPTIRTDREGLVTVRYTNTGDTDLVAPLLQIDADNASLKLLGDDVFTEDPIQQLAINPDGPAGVLAPGATGTFIFNFDPLTVAGTDIDFTVSTLTADTAIYWSSIRDEARPDYLTGTAWNPVWDNFTDGVQGTTDTYVQTLAENATYLDSLGETVTGDVDRLIAFELQQASDYQALNQRYSLGSFGRGGSFVGDLSLVVDTDGDVSLQNGGLQRTFERQANGSYAGVEGDDATLVQSTDGYRLTEVNGTTTQFLQNGKLSYVEDTNGNRITAVYDGEQLEALTTAPIAPGTTFPLPTGTALPLGETLYFTYDAQGRITQARNQAGQEVTYGYDATGELLTSVTTPAGAMQYRYDSSFNLTGITDANGTEATFTYDAQGRLTQESLTSGVETVSYVYDSTGGVTITDAAGVETQVLLNDRGQVAQLTDPLGRTLRMGYDADGNVTRMTAPDGTSTRLSYDADGNLVSQVNPLGQQLSFDYESNYDLLESVTDARGNALSYGYDAQGNLTSITYADGSDEVFGYDEDGNVTRSVNRREEAIDYSYNSRGQLLSQTNADGTTSSYTYDLRGNLLTATNGTGQIAMVYDDADRLTQITYPNGRSLAYAYDAGGRRTRMEDHDGNVVNYSYDAAGRLAGLTDGAGATIVSYSYDLVGRLAQETNGNGTYTTYSYDNAGQLLNIVNHAPGGGVNSREDYTYDAVGQQVQAATLDGTWNYSYDATGQLVGAVFASMNAEIPSQDLSYVYDAAGNRVQTIVNGETTDYSTNNLNQYSSAGDAVYGYDDDGNLISKTEDGETWGYSYDTENRLVGVVEPDGKTTQYEYDALGNRIATVYDGERTEYLVDPFGFGDVVGEYANGGVSRYTHGIGLVSRSNAVDGTAFYDSNSIGSTTGLTGSNGSYQNSYSYRPFGGEIFEREGITNPFEFIGQWGVMEDVNDLNYMRARFYRPSSGRFMSTDPIGILGQDANLYRYAINNPVQATDPQGTVIWFVVIGAAAKVLIYRATTEKEARNLEGYLRAAVEGGLLGVGGAVAVGRVTGGAAMTAFEKVVFTTHYGPFVHTVGSLTEFAVGGVFPEDYDEGFIASQLSGSYLAPFKSRLFKDKEIYRKHIYNQLVGGANKKFSESLIQYIFENKPVEPPSYSLIDPYADGEFNWKNFRVEQLLRADSKVIVLPTSSSPGGVIYAVPNSAARSKGEPHLTTFDGVGYSFQGAGEFTLAKSQSGDLNVQVRYLPIDSRATVATAVATVVDGQRVVIDSITDYATELEIDENGNPSVNRRVSGRAPSIKIDGIEVNADDSTLATTGQLDIGNSLIYRRGSEYTIVFAGENGTLEDGDDQLVVNYFRPGTLNIVDLYLGDEKKGQINGLLGNLNDNPADDVALPDGTVLDRPLNYTEIYGDYREAWRVKDASESLFDYEAGQSVEFFNNPVFPFNLVNYNDFSPEARAEAEEFIEDQGYTPGTFEFYSAAFDFIITNKDPAFFPGADTDPGADESLNIIDDRPDPVIQLPNFTGADLELQIFSPTPQRPITAPLQITVSNAVEVGPGSFSVNPGKNIIEHSFDISADSIFYEVSPTEGSGRFGTATFNGYVINDVADALPDFTNVTIDPTNNTLGLQTSDVTFTENAIYIDVAGLSYAPGKTFELDIDFAEITTGTSAIRGAVFDDRNANNTQDTNEPGLAGVTVFLDENQNGQLDSGEQTRITNNAGEYSFTNLPANTYSIRQIAPPGYEQTFPATQTTIGDGYAIKVLEYFDSGKGDRPGPYGIVGSKNEVDVSVDVVLGNDSNAALSLPTDSFVTVSFEDEVIVNGPGDDIFIRERGPQSEKAEVYVSSDQTTFTLLGIADGGITTSLDLDAIDFNEPVRAVKIVGLDNKGGSPGFDVVSVQGLSGSITAPDFHTVSLDTGESVNTLNFGNRLVATGTFIQPNTAVASSEFSNNYQATYTIDGSGLDPLGPTGLHAAYSTGNHWTSEAGTGPTDQSIDWGFNSPQTLDAIHLWNHQSTVGPAVNDGYDVTRFDLTLFDAANNELLSLNDIAMQHDLATAQTFSFGQTIANISRVRLDIEDVQSSPTYTGLAEVGFNAV